MFGDLNRSRIIAYSAACIGLIALGSWVSIPFFPVPFTLQTLFVLLTASLMKRWAIIPVSAYIVMGAAGLPVFHNGVAGIGVLLGPTGGYLFGFLAAALVAGLAYESKSRVTHVAGIVAATLVIYVFGVSWLIVSTGLGIVPAFLAGALPFLPGDIVKACAAYGIARRLP